LNGAGPSPSLVVDANIVVRGVLGHATRALIYDVAAQRALHTSIRAVEECLGVLGRLGASAERDRVALADLLALIEVHDRATYAPRETQAADVLRLASASRNGSTRDAHLLALAWALDADIWSHDRDFAGTGWPSWSNGNLLAALGVAAAAIP